MTGTERIIAEITALKTLLISKNQSYGNQLLEPQAVFSPLQSVQRIDARIDEKLARIANVGPDAAGEDTVADLAGLLIVRMAAKRWEDERETEAFYVSRGNRSKGPCLDPEKMNGYCDQFGGSDFPDDA